MITPEIAIADLRHYLRAKGFELYEPAESVFASAEGIGSRLNTELYDRAFLLALIDSFPPLRSVLLKQGLSPEEAVRDLTNEISRDPFDKYTAETLYSVEDGYRSGSRQRLIEGSMAIACRRGRKEILPNDILEALLDIHDEESPPTENDTWTDERLHTPFNTLSHIKGRYDANLWVSLDEVRHELGLLTPSAARQIPLGQAPRRLKTAILSLLSDHPDYLANCFIIMPFHSTPFHSQVISSLRQTLRGLGYNPLRADDKAYSEDILTNIEAHLYGCRFAVAVHDRFLSDEHNANVALEVGYCMGMKKPLCLLKERTVKALPSDLQGRIYVPFDGALIEQSLDFALTRWLSDNRIAVTKWRTKQLHERSI